ncbi:macrolide family glycosyltransferase [Cohnella faecalis]|uniref:Glycosyl transferase family 1 n=1 Tax=Cohnella faecalis TaxID=2315694 RepID=A0A398CLU3_9BACL|nr:macrolide family glycosyltransferase [Cohnella faecalis]RIE00817.1 glycosyl transferase family 1 [Cohnella faecalis]
MSKILFINGPSAGHINPTFPLVEQLIEAGEEVVYFSSEEFRWKIEGMGASFRAYGNFLKSDDPLETKQFMGLILKLLSSYSIVIPGVMEQIKGETFDYVIHDSMYGCGTTISNILKLPHISTCTSFINAERMSSTQQRQDQPSGPTVSIVENVSHMKAFARLSYEVSQKFGIKRPNIDEVFFNKGQLNLVFTSSDLQPGSHSLDDSYEFVGFSPSRRAGELEFPFERLTDQSVIYISLGTMYNNDKDFYEICFAAFASFRGKVVLSLGNRVEAGAFPCIPGNFIVRNHVPQLEILKHACMFITHGGMGSTNEALSLGVPLIIVPMAADQPIVARRIQDLGAGILLNRDDLTPDLLRTTAEQVMLNPSYSKRSAELGESLITAAANNSALRAILRFKEKMNVELSLRKGR